jgi:hypothetical protein
MTAIIREYGLARISMALVLQRSIGCERRELAGATWRVVNNDCVDETRRMPDDSVGLIVTSIPFSHQYEYSPSYNDFGHTDNNEHFWRQMDFLTPELFRHADARARLRRACQGPHHPGRHQWLRLPERYAHQRPVRRPLRAPRLRLDCPQDHRDGRGAGEQPDLSPRLVRAVQGRLAHGRRAAGVLAAFRKPPTDRSNGYADLPVFKDKALYTRPRWQYDAHGFVRSSGNRLLQPEDLDGLAQERSTSCFAATRCRTSTTSSATWRWPSTSTRTAGCPRPSC